MDCLVFSRATPCWINELLRFRARTLEYIAAMWIGGKCRQDEDQKCWPVWDETNIERVAAEATELKLVEITLPEGTDTNACLRAIIAMLSNSRTSQPHLERVLVHTWFHVEPDAWRKRTPNHWVLLTPQKQKLVWTR